MYSSTTPSVVYIASAFYARFPPKGLWHQRDYCSFLPMSIPLFILTLLLPWVKLCLLLNERVKREGWGTGRWKSVGTVRRHLKRGQPKAKGGGKLEWLHIHLLLLLWLDAAVVKYIYKYGIVWMKRRWPYCTDTVAGRVGVSGVGYRWGECKSNAFLCTLVLPSCKGRVKNGIGGTVEGCCCRQLVVSL